MANKNLHDAKIAKKDEFYTRLEDIAGELKHYREFFRGKSVLCNCDDPYESNFFKFFALNFNAWGLRKLVATCYDGSPVAGQELSLFGENWGGDTPVADDWGGDTLVADNWSGDTPVADNKGARGHSCPRSSSPKEKDARGQECPRSRCAYKIEITEVPDMNGDGAVDMTDVDILIRSDKNVLTKLRGNGDFRSAECVEMLKEADVVVTNPPFSLFREYVAQLIEHGKKFIIIGNQNAITYKEIFPLIMQNRLWLGYYNGDMAFTVPKDSEPRATRYWQDETGQKWRSMGNICWFTNIDHKKRHEMLDLYKTYTPEEYPRYDNYNAINVDKVADIPMDYDGVMGVPITFLCKYNPDQFEIVGCTESEGKGLSNGIMTSTPPEQRQIVTQPLVHGAKRYKRIFIKPASGGVWLLPQRTD